MTDPAPVRRRTYTHTAEAKAAIGLANRGQKRTAEQRRRMSEGHTGKRAPVSDATRAKLRAAQIGKPKRTPVSDATRAKLRAALLGKKRAPFTAEHRARMRTSASSAQRWICTTCNSVPMNHGQIGRYHKKPGCVTVEVENGPVPDQSRTTQV
jgi:NUMOD3 motif